MPANLDPRIGTDAQSQDIDGLMFNSLVSFDAKINVQPDLATSWEEPDPLTWIFHLRSGVRFHDGRPLTSADVKFTFDSIMGIVPPGAAGPIISAKRGTFDHGDFDFGAGPCDHRFSFARAGLFVSVETGAALDWYRSGGRGGGFRPASGGHWAISLRERDPG